MVTSSFSSYIEVAGLCTVLTTVILGLFLLAHNPKRGLISVIVLLPFLGLLRRLFNTQGRMAFDPLLILPDIIILFVFLHLGIYKYEFLRPIGTNRIAKSVTLLLIIMILHMFNPLQGSILAGVVSAKLYIIPLLYFYIGYFTTEDTIRTICFVIATTGTIAALYGVHQAYFGFLPFDEEWFKNTNFQALYVYSFIRPMSSFSSPEEFSKYLALAAPIVLGLYLQSKKQIAWLIAFVFICYGIILIAHRSAIIPCLFSIILLLLLAFRSANQRNLLFMSVGAGLVMLLLLFLFFPFLLQQSVLSKESRIQAFTLHTLSGISNPHRVDTFHSRLILWKKHLINAFTKNPLGYGLSYATMAAEKFGQPRIGPHSYLISIIASCGLMAGILLIYIVWLCMKQIFRVVRTLEGDSVIYSVAASTIGLFVTFFMFGGDAGLYSIAPLTWFFVGWFSRYDDIQDSSLPLGIQI